MGLYTRALFEQHTQAVEAAKMCISAAIAGSNYAGRLNAYMDDYLDIAQFFWARCPITRKKLEQPGPDVKEIAQVFLTLTRGVHFGGFAARSIEAKLECVQRKLRGKLLGTRMILADGDKKPKCLDLENHRQPCQCKPMTLARLAAAKTEEV